MTYKSGLRFGALLTMALLSGTPAMAQSTSISTEYLMTVYIRKDPALVADSNLVISRDQTGAVPIRRSGDGLRLHWMLAFGFAREKQ
jgi:hypothetical protein